MASDRGPSFLSCSNSSVPVETPIKESVDFGNHVLSLIIMLTFSFQYIFLIPNMVATTGIYMVLFFIFFYVGVDYYLSIILTRSAAKVGCTSLPSLIKKLFKEHRGLYMFILGLQLLIIQVTDFLLIITNATKLCLYLLNNGISMFSGQYTYLPYIITLVLFMFIMPFIFIKDLTLIKKYAIFNTFLAIIMIFALIMIFCAPTHYDMSIAGKKIDNDSVLFDLKMLPEAFLFFMFAFSQQFMVIEVCSEFKNNTYSTRKSFFQQLTFLRLVLFSVIAVMSFVFSISYKSHVKGSSTNIFMQFMIHAGKSKSLFLCLNSLFVMSSFFENVLNFYPMIKFIEDYLLPKIRVQRPFSRQSLEWNKIFLKISYLIVILLTIATCLYFKMKTIRIITLMSFVLFFIVNFIFPLKIFFKVYEIGKKDQMTVYMVLSFFINITAVIMIMRTLV